VLFVDSFGPRGYARGFAAGTHASRPPEINEVTIRPLDAYAALKYLRERGDVVKDRVYLQGWSNGGSTTLAAMATQAPALAALGQKGFRAAVSMYPGCTPVVKEFGKAYKPYAPVLLMIGSEDEEVNPKTCASFADRVRKAGGSIDLVWYDGAQHSYDTPIAAREAVPANELAAADSKRRAEEFFSVRGASH